MTTPGEWGPWVDGGAWLQIEGTAVDWIYRDTDRVHAVWADARQGHYQFHFQVGHPLGVPDFAYAGEVALGVVLADPDRRAFNTPRSDARLPHSAWQHTGSGRMGGGFVIQIARRGADKGDATYVAGCVFRAIGVCVHGLHGAWRQWLINEKGAVPSAGRLPSAPPDFATRAHALLAHIGTAPRDLHKVLDAAEALIHDVTAAVRRHRDASSTMGLTIPNDPPSTSSTQGL